MTYPPPGDPYSGQVPPQPYGQSPYGQPAPAFAGWGSRVGAYLIDGLIVAPFSLLATLLGMSTDDVTGLQTPNALYYVFLLAGFVVSGYNRWFQAGKTGQSWGKKALNIRLLNEATGHPIGAGKAFLRDLAHILDGLACCIGYLWPLWDAKKQTFSDKVCSTLVVRS
ncbi:hypothetical protein Q0Z83_065410 [Actinoplanes sichuanensis]|uniref:RDD family protein n=1 Tax=Actinoplanes sichuanensis TaxID=512349 RepID=A0ABW4ANX8_9ACTN|nr:RDD family protein [Actinoplanes sichuanensis]BEL08350.1 hypothetical protein Q0Z83_065410 [Actinoplanes sichuanensis]